MVEAELEATRSNRRRRRLVEQQVKRQHDSREAEGSFRDV